MHVWSYLPDCRRKQRHQQHLLCGKPLGLKCSSSSIPRRRKAGIVDIISPTHPQASRGKTESRLTHGPLPFCCSHYSPRCDATLPSIMAHRKGVPNILLSKVKIQIATGNFAYTQSWVLVKAERGTGLPTYRRLAPPQPVGRRGVFYSPS